jgi:hypothetical protein
LVFRYLVYGLTVTSDLELRGLRVCAAVGSVDVEIRAQSGSFVQAPTKGNWHHLEPEESQLVWDGVGSFLIKGGRSIGYQEHPGAMSGSVGQALLGPAMGLLLQQRGLVPLHASALAIDGVAIGIAGDSGMGKSTTAYALHERDHPLVTDDIAALSCHGDEVLIPPGHAALRLWPDSLLRVSANPSVHERLHADTEKRRIDLAEGIATEPLRLASIVVLFDGDEERLERLSAPRAAIELLRHYYYPELTGKALGPSVLLQQCGRLAERLQVWRLHRRKLPESIEGVVGLIEQCRDSLR